VNIVTDRDHRPFRIPRQKSPAEYERRRNRVRGAHVRAPISPFRDPHIRAFAVDLVRYAVTFRVSQLSLRITVSSIARQHRPPGALAASAWDWTTSEGRTTCCYSGREPSRR
jgi:hypothetical protein